MTYLPESTNLPACRKARIWVLASPGAGQRYPLVGDFCPDAVWVPTRKKKTQNKNLTRRFAMLRPQAVAVILRRHSEEKD